MEQERILSFIKNFRTRFKDKKTLLDVFVDGYCYYFSSILQSAFGGGEIVVVTNESHVVWVKDGIAYDINGIYDLAGKNIVEFEKYKRKNEYLHVS